MRPSDRAAAQAPHASAVLAALWRDAALPALALDRIELTGRDPVMPSPFALGTALQAALGAAALASAELGRQRGAAAQTVNLDIADVVRESACRYTIDGRTPPIWDKFSGLYRCGSDVGQPGWVRLHTNFAHHRDGTLALLGLSPGPGTERASVAQALQRWSAEDFESAAAARGLVAAAVRTPQQWQAHPQAAAVAEQPLVGIDRIGEAPPRVTLKPLTDNELPLRGLRVLDLTRILAGPVAGRTLAAHGADVLLINSPHLPNIEAIADTSRGKLSAHIDLHTETGRDALRALVSECDVFLQGYRPGGLAALGFGHEDLARLRPGIVSVSLSAYGDQGPWRERRGFDSLVQSATGMSVTEADAFGSKEPRALPLQALDFGAGYLLAFGALAALLRQREGGGSWGVRVSLAGVGHWVRSLGRLAEGPAAKAPAFEGSFEETDSGFGRLVAVRHAVRFSHAQTGWARPSMPPGSHAPTWPARA